MRAALVLAWSFLLAFVQAPAAPTNVAVNAAKVTSTQSRFVTCTTTTANLTQSTVSTAVSAAADGATVCLPAGSATWSSTITFSASKAVTIAGQAAIQGSGGTTTITCSSSACFGNNATGGSTKDHRVTGITFPPFAFAIWWSCPGGGCSGALTRNRFDHNTISASSSTDAVLGGVDDGTQKFYGLIDHNTYTASLSAWLYQSIITGSDTGTSPIGTANMLYFEDNTLSITTMDNAGNGCIDLQGNASPVVWRHNTVTNCLLTSHGTTHSGGPSAFVVSDNTFIANSGTDVNFRDGSRAFHHQGSGEIIAYNNVFTASAGKTGNAISVIDYCAYTNCIDGTGTIICDGTRVQHPDGNTAPTATYRGYPCWHQPARDFATSPVGGNLMPMYAWNNRWSDAPSTKLDLVVETGVSGGVDYTLNHLVANRDYFNAVSANAQTSATSPFNGTTGMGFGTLANRPTTCTTGAETGGGVGYYATDTDILYRCSATNTWTTQYNFGAVPYPYPWP